MSVKLLSYVFDRSKQTGVRLLVMLAIADSANDDGYCWLRKAKIAEKTRLSADNLRRYINQLAESGELELYDRYRDLAEGARASEVHMSNLYKIMTDENAQVPPPQDLIGIVKKRLLKTDGEGGDRFTPTLPIDIGGHPPISTPTLPIDIGGLDPSLEPSLDSSIKSIAPIVAASPSSKKKRKPTAPTEDSAPTEDQSKSSNDVNAMISAWWEWVPLRPLLRGKVAEAKTHFANKTIRQHAENITKRGIGAADMARFLADVRFSKVGEKYFHLQEKPMGFTFAATILEEWVSVERAKRWYTWDQPRITPARPGLSRDATTTNEELRLDPDFIVDVPGPYVTAQEAANGKPEFNTDPDPEPEPSNSNDAAILRKLGIPL